jgi:hypothetical protein
VSIRAQIKPLVVASLFVAIATSIGGAATKDAQAPDREMLKMMEFLRDMEMIKQMEMLQNMEQLENAGEPKITAPQKTPPAKTRENVK